LFGVDEQKHEVLAVEEQGAAEEHANEADYERFLQNDAHLFRVSTSINLKRSPIINYFD
jgi:hypothetical protein